ncbi:MAG: hypothetical protein DRG24_02150, partial [Epsilonproteobacteria bacterium]
MSFNTLGLSAKLLHALSDKGYTLPTPVQEQVIPAILARRDILAAAQTGTGKTAGFTLPILQLLNDETAQRDTRRVRALILTPTRELAIQVGASVAEYGKYLPLNSAVIYGGASAGVQIRRFKEGIDTLIATPGRLLDHIRKKNVDLSSVEFLVLDEADRMLDMGFIGDIREIISQLPAKRQNLLFSATFSPEIRKLAGGILQKPAQVEISARNSSPEEVKHEIHLVNKEDKQAHLAYIIGSRRWEQVLVFTRTRKEADHLGKQMKLDGLPTAVIHGEKTQGARARALEGFKEGTVRVLVATDIAARGLDIDKLPHVVNFDLPLVAEDYLHRIGRTGRAGNEGTALSLVSREEFGLLKDIEKLIK